MLLSCHPWVHELPQDGSYYVYMPSSGVKHKKIRTDCIIIAYNARGWFVERR
jgi:hypothetical protein